MPKLEKINRTQLLYLSILENTQMNALDGERVAYGLINHVPDAWEACYLVNCDTVRRKDRKRFSSSLITLRDLSSGFHNADMLVILTTEQHVDLLEERAMKAWGASTFHAYRGEEVEDMLRSSGTDQKHVIVTVWWD